MYNEEFEYEICACRKIDLAQDYAPELSPHAATNRLSRWLRYNPHLWAELQASGYKPQQKMFTSKQVSIILKHLGEP